MFEQHPLRQTLNDEVHARPPVPLDTPEFVTYFAFVHDEHCTGREAAHLQALAEAFDLPAPETGSGHLFLETAQFRLKWERHNEFSSYTFFCRLDAEQGIHTLQLPPRLMNWCQAIPGQLITATRIELRHIDEVPPETLTSQNTPQGTMLVAARVADGAGWVCTDFHLHEGFSHFLLVDNGLTPRQAGRMVQRLVEIETYRVMALLAFPVSKEVGRLVQRAEAELADLMDQLGQARNAEDDRCMLGRLTRLAAEVERSIARTSFRFGAAAAYYRLVQQRIEELRELRLPGFLPISEFMDRRLAPAINTCAAIARRQDELSGRIARNSQLLRTRVDVELEKQNQALLAQMNRRASIQLRLQETVEGLSVVAITYYGSQLVNYMAKGAKTLIEPATPELVTALSIPLIAGLVALGLRRMRKLLAAEDGQGDQAGGHGSAAAHRAGTSAPGL